jgi:SH3-like domain-containing protein
MSHLSLFTRLIALFAVLIAVPAFAEKDSKAPPFWGSLKAKEVNMRSGPGEDYHITHVYRREGLPIKVLREMEIWRLVEDPGGTRGWMMVRFITRSRSAIINGKDDQRFQIEMAFGGRGYGKIGRLRIGMVPF